MWPEDRGKLRYGSPQVSMTADATVPGGMGTFGWDDDGVPAMRTKLVEKGIFVGYLTSRETAPRIGRQSGGAMRADGWNRIPLIRMTNVNLEPGDSTMDEMIGSIARGVMMATNSSWSIDDSRNKFQFGCEWGQLIENGKLTAVVKNPNYRGISANFWRSLKRVGDESTLEVLGTPYCGKGEPSQLIRVGHASPACVFAAVDVFGGDA